ncbi:MAG: flagellar biosynthetic protein FliR [bacterium]|nr:flagellar biosynthetic protein FliR [bacterium]
MENIIDKIPYFMLVFIRISAFMAFVPFFNNMGFTASVKVGFAFLVSLLLFPTISYTSWVIPSNIPGFLLLVTQEVLVGILMGLTFLILLFGLQLAGRIIGFQMAFSLANVVDTTFGSNANVLSVMLVMLGTMLIIALNGDHYFLYSLKRSYDVLVPGTIGITKALINDLSAMIIHSFEVGFKLASPAVILLLCIDLTLGLIGKTATKMQIFFVGLPLKISVGLFSFTLVMGFVVSLWGKDVVKLPQYLFDFFKLMRI